MSRKENHVSSRDPHVAELLRVKLEAEEALARWQSSTAPEAADRVAEYSAIVLDVTAELQATLREKWTSSEED